MFRKCALLRYTYVMHWKTSYIAFDVLNIRTSERYFGDTQQDLHVCVSYQNVDVHTFHLSAYVCHILRKEISVQGAPGEMCKYLGMYYSSAFERNIYINVQPKL